VARSFRTQTCKLEPRSRAPQTRKPEGGAVVAIYRGAPFKKAWPRTYRSCSATPRPFPCTTSTRATMRPCTCRDAATPDISGRGLTAIPHFAVQFTPLSGALPGAPCDRVNNPPGYRFHAGKRYGSPTVTHVRKSRSISSSWAIKKCFIVCIRNFARNSDDRKSYEN